MSLHDIQQLASMATNILKVADDQETIATPVLAAKLNQACLNHPQDQTIGQMARVVNDLVDKNTLLIRRATLKELYQKLYSRNTKFAEVCQEELGITASHKAEKRGITKDLAPLKPYIGDPVLANILPALFDKSLPLKPYSKIAAEQAVQSVSRLLESDLPLASVSVDNGNESVLIVKADYETPKGHTSFYIPVEVVKNQIIQPLVMVGNNGIQELSYLNVKNYLTSFLGHKLQINGTQILQALTNAAAEKREISNTEMAVMRLNASRARQNEKLATDQFLAQKVAVAFQEVKTPKFEQSETFAKKLSSARGQAEFQLGQVVSQGREHLARELVGLGYKNPQIAVAKHNDHTVFYSVSLNAGRVGFTVPIKIAKGQLVKPNVMLANGSVLPFTQQGIQYLTEGVLDTRAAAIASPQFELSSHDLIQNIKKALEQGNHAMAEDALNVLAKNGDSKAYTIGFDLFMRGLSVKQATSTSSCSRIIKNSTSQHPICSHTGLPLHKVYQDQYGHCLPHYHRSYGVK